MKKKVWALLIAAELIVSVALGTITIIDKVSKKDSDTSYENAWTEEDIQNQVDSLSGRGSTLPEEKPTAIAGKNLVENGASTYKIITPSNATTAEGVAASEVQTFLQQSTGCKIEIVTEGVTNVEKYISIGETEVFKNSSLQETKETLGDAGCMISTVGDNVFIHGSDSTGVLNGAYRFLHYTVDYEAYSPKEIYISKEKVVPLYNFSYVHTPSIVVATSSASMRSVLNAARMNMWDGRWGSNSIDGATWAGSYFAHSLLHLLDPDTAPGKNHTGDINTEDGWYSNKQLCLTKESAQIAMAEKVATVFKQSASKRIMLGGMDNGQSCACNTCKSEANQYGGVGGIYARFLNSVSEKVEAILGEDAEFYIYGMAYNAYAAPPIITDGKGNYTPVDTSVVLNKHAGMMVTTMGACHYHPMGSNEMCDFAKQFALRFEGWAALTDNLVGYTYGTNFYNYMIPFNDFDCVAENLSFLSDLGYEFVYDQTTGNNEINGFIELKTYIKSKASWDASTKAYADKYIDDFFVNYYKVAAVPMKNFYKELRSHYAMIQDMRGEYDVSMYDSKRYAVKSSWPLQVVERFEQHIQDAYEAIDNATMSETVKTEIRRRVMAEELMCRYIRLAWYKSMYPADQYDEIYAKFVEDCKYCGATALAEGNGLN